MNITGMHSIMIASIDFRLQSRWTTFTHTPLPQYFTQFLNVFFKLLFLIFQLTFSTFITLFKVPYYLLVIDCLNFTFEHFTNQGSLETGLRLVSWGFAEHAHVLTYFWGRHFPNCEKHWRGRLNFEQSHNWLFQCKIFVTRTQFNW